MTLLTATTDMTRAYAARRPDGTWRLPALPSELPPWMAEYASVHATPKNRARLVRACARHVRVNRAYNRAWNAYKDASDAIEDYEHAHRDTHEWAPPALQDALDRATAELRRLGKLWRKAFNWKTALDHSLHPYATSRAYAAGGQEQELRAYLAARRATVAVGA